MVKEELMRELNKLKILSCSDCKPCEICNYCICTHDDNICCALIHILHILKNMPEKEFKEI